MSRINGDDYVRRMLSKEGDNAVSLLLEKAHNQETVWLELKADPFCTRDKDSTEKGDRIWHTLKEVIAMVNTRGGCIICGIDDKTKDVCALYDKDGKEVMETEMDVYHRQIRDEILSQKKFDIEKSGKAGSRGKKVMLAHSVSSYCEFKIAKYNNRCVSIILVKPSSDKNDNWVYVTIDNKEELLIRQSGDEGRVHRCSASEIRTWTRPHLDFDRDYEVKKFNNMLSPVERFVGRKDILSDIAKNLDCVDAWRIPFVFGPAGIGKSQIAFKYAQIHSVEYETLLFANCANARSIVDVFAHFASNPDFKRRFLPENSFPERVPQTNEELFMSVRMALADGRLGRTLLVLDDVRHSNLLRSELIYRYLGRHGDLSMLDIIVTARNPKLRFVEGDVMAMIEVSMLSEEEGLCIIGQKRPFKTERNRDMARKLVQKVCGNPWAIDLIAEYLKQKSVQSDRDYENCLQLLENEFIKCFPPKDRDASRIGNATGVVGLRELEASTIEGMEPEERDFCRLLAMGFEKYSENDSLRAAMSKLYEREISLDEWSLYVESLSEKCIVGRREDEHGLVQLYFRDDLLRGLLISEKLEQKFASSYAEYIRKRCSVSRVSLKMAKMFLSFLRKFPIPDMLKVVFDQDRVGWPFGFMGCDNILSQSSTDANKTLMDEWEDIQYALKEAEKYPDYQADVFELRGRVDDSSLKAGEFKEYLEKVLNMRKNIYKDNSLMLGRSYLHAADWAHGELEYEDIVPYLENAIRLFSQSGEIVYKAYAHDYWASLANQKIDGSESDEKYRMIVSEQMKIAYDLYPEIYTTNVNFDADDFQYQIQNGEYCW